MKKTTLAGGRLELKFADIGTETEAKTFTGYGAVFNNTDFASDIIAPGAFATTIAEHKTHGTVPSMFFNHDAFSMPMGKWLALEEDDHGLKVAGEFLDTTGGRDAYAAVKAGAVTGLSIGYIATGYEIDGNTRTITEAKLIEISVVTFPCNDLARVSSVKNKENDMTDDDFLAKLAELGIDEEDAKGLLAKRNKSDAEHEDIGDEKTDEEAEGEQEDKYDQAAVVAAIKAIVATTKEKYVR
jgi:HK97 family phage prohead protease